MYGAVQRLREAVAVFASAPVWPVPVPFARCRSIGQADRNRTTARDLRIDRDRRVAGRLFNWLKRERR